MLSSHYKQPINFSKELLESSFKQLNKIYLTLNLRSLDDMNYTFKIPNSLLDDINTPQAISEIHEIINKMNEKEISDSEWIKNKRKLEFYGKLMGLFKYTPDEWLKINQKEINKKETSEIEILIKERDIARQNRDFKLADKIREKLRKKQVFVEDSENKSTWKIIDE